MGNLVSPRLLVRLEEEQEVLKCLEWLLTQTLVRETTASPSRFSYLPSLDL